MGSQTVPKLITFDGEARSGKGTIVQATKDYLRDECGYNVMLMDRGQTFRALVVATARAGVNVDSPVEIDAYLSDVTNVASATQFVKDVYHMDKEERDGLLYTNEVGENSAKIGGRPLAQQFSMELMEKWFRDAGEEGIEVILLDGRSLESKARKMLRKGLCEYTLGLYFICDAQVGARRTLGYAATPYAELDAAQKNEVDEFVTKVNERNHADMTRDVERLVRPEDAPLVVLPAAPTAGSHMYTVDTSADMTKSEMYEPISSYVAQTLATVR